MLILAVYRDEATFSECLRNANKTKKYIHKYTKVIKMPRHIKTKIYINFSSKKFHLSRCQ